MQDYPLSPKSLVVSFWGNRELILTLVKREVLGRYRGSVLGILWSFFNPVLLLLVFTFVFSVVFKARWGGDIDSQSEFALILFIGLIIYNLFSECLVRSPTIVLSNVNYVKKVIFPLEILSWIVFLTALFHAFVSFLVWLIFYFIILGIPPASALLFPLLLIPLLFLSLGLSWFLASMGVYIRDVTQFVGICTMALMFLTPIFYPLSAVPEKYRMIIYANPLTYIITQAHGLLVFDETLNWLPYISISLFSLFVAWMGYAWFQKTRKGFADVL